MPSPPMKRTDVADHEQEMSGYMPRTFVLMYYALVEKAVAQYTSPLGHPGEGGQQTGRRYVQHDGGLRDEEALTIKRKIDRRLRQIVRDVEAGTAQPLPACPSCGKYGDHGWLHCAWCGASMRTVTEISSETNANDVNRELERRMRQEPVRRPELR
ncbi:hypothetical protein GIKK_69 [Gordonia phage GiKK]|nr:hypothetical protein GIKK_69 [Gordonia phage GiKK]